MNGHGAGGAGEQQGHNVIYILKGPQAWEREGSVRRQGTPSRRSLQSPAAGPWGLDLGWVQRRRSVS